MTIPYSKGMTDRRARIRFWTLPALAGVLLLGCSRDPNVRKQKYFQSGTQYLQDKKYRKAAIEFENAIKLDPRFAQAHYLLAESLLQQSLWNGAYQELLRTADLDPQNTDALVDLAKLLLAGRKFQDAHDRAAAVLAVKPDSFEMQLVLANADTALGNSQLATDETAKAIELAPGRPEGYVAMALLQSKDGKLVDAEANFQKAVSVNGSFLPARILLGQFYQRQKRWPEAEQQYEAAIAAMPNSPIPRAQLANLYEAQNRKDEAERTSSDAKKAISNDPSGYRMLGDYYIGIGDSKKALGEFASLSEEHKQDVSVKRTYIQLLLLDNRVEQANTLNEQILKANPKDAEALIVRGEIQGRNGHANDAISTLQHALMDAPENAFGHFYLGVAYNQTGAMSQAKSEWRTAVHLAPSLEEAQRALGALAVQQGDWGSLAETADQLILTQPRAALGYLYRGVERIARGDQPAAEMNFRKALELAPGDAASYIQMGKLRLQQKRPEEAEKLFQQALVHDASSTDALNGLVLSELQMKLPIKALAAVREQIAASPNNSGFYLLLGQLLLNTKDAGAAETAAQKAIDFNPNNVDAFLLLARLEVARGGVDQAAASYQQAIQKNPRGIQLYLGLAGLEETRGNWQQAQKLYQQALQIKSDDPIVANNLAYLLIEHGGDRNVALSLAQTARQGLPNLGVTADTLGWAYYYVGLFSPAVSILQEAVKESTENPTYHHHLGMAYQKTGDYARAKVQLERALELRPAPQQADEIRKALSENSGS